MLFTNTISMLLCKVLGTIRQEKCGPAPPAAVYVCQAQATPPWIMKLGGLKTSGCSLNSKTKEDDIYCFFLVVDFNSPYILECLKKDLKKIICC